MEMILWALLLQIILRCWYAEEHNDMKQAIANMFPVGFSCAQKTGIRQVLFDILYFCCSCCDQRSVCHKRQLSKLVVPCSSKKSSFPSSELDRLPFSFPVCESCMSDFSIFWTDTVSNNWYQQMQFDTHLFHN